jgi:hypothetical protein
MKAAEKSARPAAEGERVVKLRAVAEIVRCPYCEKRLLAIEDPQDAYFKLVIVCRCFVLCCRIPKPATEIYPLLAGDNTQHRVNERFYRDVTPTIKTCRVIEGRGWEALEVGCLKLS